MEETLERGAWFNLSSYSRSVMEDCTADHEFLCHVLCLFHIFTTFFGLTN